MLKEQAIENKNVNRDLIHLQAILNYNETGDEEIIEFLNCTHK